ncbi:MAG TPA: hypothetical protein VFW98_01730 [Gemmatimonadaceae bacterium]|nr:hypothetical protein [Gemmatimonadaceae bacterium]
MPTPQPADHSEVRALRKQVRLLKAHALITTTALVIVAFAAFARSPSHQRFDEIDVQRLNLVEPNGKLDMVLSNRARFPDPIVDGRTLKRSVAPSPGMLFYNDEGDEDGGLGFEGKLVNGKPSAGGSLLFDRFHQDQTVGIEYSEHDGRYSAGLRVWDRPDVPVAEVYDRVQAIRKLSSPEAQRRAVQALRDSGLVGEQRVFVGQAPGRTASVVLSDRRGRPRITMRVDSAGTPTLDFLDAKGQVIAHLPSSAGGPR